MQPRFYFYVIVTVRILRYKFKKVDNWLKKNVQDMGGRAVLVVYKGGKVVYNHAENNLDHQKR